MRSAIAVAVLALAASLDLVTAKKSCKPKSKTKTRTPAAATSTPGPVVVKNDVSNGNFAVVSSSPNEIPDYEVQGDASIVVGAGYTGDNSPEENAVSLAAANGGKKRDTEPAASVAQTLRDLDTSKDYTIRFFYTVASNAVSNACTLESSLGGQIFDSRAIDAVVMPSDNDDFQWVPVLTAVPVKKSTADIAIALRCEPGGSADVYVDQIFVSDDVTPENIGNFFLSYGPGDAADIQPPSAGPTSLVNRASAASFTSVPSTVAPVPRTTTSSSRSRWTTSSIPPTTTIPSMASIAAIPVVVSQPSKSKAAPSSKSSKTTTTTTTTTTRSTTTKKPQPSATVKACPADIDPPGICTLTKTAAPGSICNQLGTVTGVPYQLDLDTFPEQYRERFCAFQCQLDPTCKGFGFDWDQFPYTCLFISTSVTNAGFVKTTNASAYWYDLGCYTCINCGGSGNFNS